MANSTARWAIRFNREMTMVLDDSQVVMYPGDVMVQRGTNHAWVNRSDDYCTMAFVLIDAEGKRGGE